MIGLQFVMMETVIAGATDVWPHILRPRKALFTFICCMVGFVLGIPQACYVSFGSFISTASASRPLYITVLFVSLLKKGPWFCPACNHLQANVLRYCNISWLSVICDRNCLKEQNS